MENASLPTTNPLNTPMQAEPPPKEKTDKAPYGIFVAVGAFVIILLVGILFLISSNKLKTDQTSKVNPTSFPQQIPEEIENTPAADYDDVDSLESEVNSIDLNELDKDTTDLEVELKNLTN